MVLTKSSAGKPAHAISALARADQGALAPPLGGSRQFTPEDIYGQKMNSRALHFLPSNILGVRG